MAIRFILAYFENFDDMLDSIHSLADVDHLIIERVAYTKTQKGKNLTRDIHYDERTANNEP